MTNINNQDKDVNSRLRNSYENTLRNIARESTKKEYFTISGPSIETDGSFIEKASSNLKNQIPSFIRRVIGITDLQDGNDLKRIN